MNIRIQRLELTNFKCFRHKEFTFNEDVTTIRGRNGVGKTTIADAILWCLFGKNSQGQSNFDLKTHDDNGKTIPNLDHSVEMDLLLETEVVKPVTLKRTLKENWIKKRGYEEMVFKNNTTEYMVNGDAYTAKDYDIYIASLINENVFKAITNPSYFPSLKWQEQRAFLTELAGDISTNEIVGEDNAMEVLAAQLDESKDIIAYRKHLSYQIKGIKDKLEKIPVRLEEQNKALPEELEWERLSKEYEEAKNGLKEIDEKIVAIKSGNGGDVQREQVRSEIKKVHSDLDAIEEQYRIVVREEQKQKDNKIAEASQKFNVLVTTQRDLESQVGSFETLKARCQQTLERCEEEAQEIRVAWAENLNKKFEWSDEDNVCPTCGQSLPEPLLKVKIQTAIESLNLSKSKVKEKLTKQAEDVKKIRSDAEAQIKDFDQKKLDAEKNLADVKEQINSVFSEKAKIEKTEVKSVEQRLAEDGSYQERMKIKQELQMKLESVGVSEENDNTLAGLEEMKSTVTEGMRILTNQLATKEQYDKIQKLIEDIQEEKKELVKQLSELERKEDVARRYQDRQNHILEERVNQHFSLVQWKMFRTVNNGGDPFDEPYCECYVNGVAYHDGLNQAARLNAGLDIINALCKHYRVSAPILLDNAESTINILQTIGQQVRLEVFDSELSIV